MAIKRSYYDGCAAAHALDLIGERWALLIVRELLLGPKRFTHLQAGLAGISPNVLTQRLNELEAAFVVQRRKLPLPASAWVYELTEWGRELEPIILRLAHWGVRSVLFTPPAGLGADAMMLSLRTFFDPHKAHGFAATIRIELPDDQFDAAVADSRITLARTGNGQVDAAIQVDSGTLVKLAYGKGDIEQALQDREFSFAGNKILLTRFLSLFTLPEGALART
ncbi:transcriptional regulator [Candidimonas sp. SYP-B2681]|uniref:winged helix-turn-helix transcriptional regulator n=1 Tax=Candidimonas sp. SYP-B2681 TaxID=2497686 RepID=UPI000F883F2F|nr:winged helix-turn-helix transcriptional regulator [Candidimonas sp. SYP-B2681]RTZ47797.1 transcriptional regulator [Candidimonas sp. SYP-B2681]